MRRDQVRHWRRRGQLRQGRPRHRRPLTGRLRALRRSTRWRPTGRRTQASADRPANRARRRAVGGSPTARQRDARRRPVQTTSSMCRPFRRSYPPRVQCTRRRQVPATRLRPVWLDRPSRGPGVSHKLRHHSQPRSRRPRQLASFRRAAAPRATTRRLDTDSSRDRAQRLQRRAEALRRTLYRSDGARPQAGKQRPDIRQRHSNGRQLRAASTAPRSCPEPAAVPLPHAPSRASTRRLRERSATRLEVAAGRRAAKRPDQRPRSPRSRTAKG